MGEVGNFGNFGNPPPLFSDWLDAQIDRDDAVGDLARDHALGVATGIHGRHHTPEEFRALVFDVLGASRPARVALDLAAREWGAS